MFYYKKIVERLAWSNSKLDSLHKKIEQLEEAVDLRKKIEQLEVAVDSLAKVIDQQDIKTTDKPILKGESLKGESVAIIGVRGHGKKHIAAFNKLKDCYISWICDVDSKVGKAAVEEIYKISGHRPRFTQNYKDMLKDKTVDAVSIASPHHCHAEQAINTLKANKHVYIEKPLTQAYDERFAIEAAAKKSDKFIQAGTQLRSNTSLLAAGQFMQEGGLGEVELVHCIIHKDRPMVPSVAAQSKIPKTVDYDLWCGSRAKQDVTRSKFHYHWHWLWDFGNGALGNNGIHRIDVARIALNLKGYGEKVVSLGGRYGPADSGETPNNMLGLHKFGKTWVLQDVLGLKPAPYKGMENAVVFYGTKGTIVYKTGYAALVDEQFNEIRRFDGKQLNHYYNFLLAIRKNDSSLIRGTLDEGLISGDLCHFGNASYRTAKKESSFESAEKLLQDLKVPSFVLERLNALQQNLTENNEKHVIRIGEVLELGEVGAKKPVLNTTAADAFLTSKS